MKMRVVLPALIVSAMIPFTATAAPAATVSELAHCERTEIIHPDGTIIRQEKCTYNPDGSA